MSSIKTYISGKNDSGGGNMNFDLYKKNRTICTYPKLRQTIYTDMLVIGGGICGLLTAYLLCKNGLQTVLVEQNLIASGKTRYLCGILNGNDYKKDISQKEYSRSFTNIMHIAKLIHKSTNVEKFPQLYLQETKTCEKAIKNTTILKNALLPNNAEYRTNGILFTKKIAAIDTVEFCKDLASYLSLYGTEIYENTKVLSYGKGLATTDAGQIHAKTIINCTNQSSTNKKYGLVMEFPRCINSTFSVLKNNKNGYVIYPYLNRIICMGHLSKQSNYISTLSKIYNCPTIKPITRFITDYTLNPILEKEIEIRKYVTQHILTESID